MRAGEHFLFFEKSARFSVSFRSKNKNKHQPRGKNKLPSVIHLNTLFISSKQPKRYTLKSLSRDNGMDLAGEFRISCDAEIVGNRLFLSNERGAIARGGKRADSIFGKRNVSLSRKSRLLHSLKISKESNIVGIVGVRTRSTYVIVSSQATSLEFFFESEGSIEEEFW